MSCPVTSGSRAAVSDLGFMDVPIQTAASRGAAFGWHGCSSSLPAHQLDSDAARRSSPWSGSKDRFWRNGAFRRGEWSCELRCNDMLEGAQRIRGSRVARDRRRSRRNRQPRSIAMRRPTRPRLQFHRPFPKGATRGPLTDGPPADRGARPIQPGSHVGGTWPGYCILGKSSSSWKTMVYLAIRMFDRFLDAVRAGVVASASCPPSRPVHAWRTALRSSPCPGRESSPAPPLLARSQ